MTASERWELGLFLSLLVVACLCLTAILNLNNLPRLFALHSGVDAADPISPTASPAPPTIEFSPQVPALGGGQLMELPHLPQLPLPADQAALTPAKPPQILPKAKVSAKAKPEIKIFNGEKYRYVKTLQLRVTAYAPDPRCTWPYPGTTTASGLSVKTNGGRLVAADTQLIPMHALVSVPGYASGAAVPVLDRGGAIKGHRLDVLLPTFDKAKDWGSRTLSVKVYLPIDD
jgi:3D (Asp-Asp-Asp) domain-containing protein